MQATALISSQKEYELQQTHDQKNSHIDRHKPE
jgi:hypothetical protein